jgi:tetratricopeptide (TPR) repeat protein
LRPSLTRTAYFLLTAHLLAQQPENLLERIRNSHLPPERRQALAAAFSAKNLASMEEILDHEVSAAGRSPLAAELEALAGAVEFLHGRMGRAALAFSQADRLTPLGDPDRFTWAMALVNLGDDKGAREQLTRLAASHPDTPLYIYWLARIDYHERRYDDAIERLHRVIRLDPSSARAYDNLGLALDMSGRPEEARDVFLKAVDLNRKLPDPSPWPPHNLGYLLVRLLEFKEAEKALRESLKYDPKFATAHYHLARALDGDGRDSEAIDEYRVAISIDPTAVEALYSLGLLYRRHGRTAEADAAFAEYKRLKAAAAQPQAE